MRFDQVARVAMAGTVLGALSTSSFAAVSLSSAPTTPIPTPTFDVGAVTAAPEDGLPMDGPHLPVNPDPVDGATIVAAAVTPALAATHTVPAPVRTVPVPRATHQAASVAAPVEVPVVVPVVAPVAVPVVEAPVVREIRLPRDVRKQIRLACSMDLLDEEMCSWGAPGQGRSSSR